MNQKFGIPCYVHLGLGVTTNKCITKVTYQITNWLSCPSDVFKAFFFPYMYLLPGQSYIRLKGVNTSPENQENKLFIKGFELLTSSFKGMILN